MPVYISLQMMTSTALSTLIMIMLSSSCKKSKLTEETQTGANTFSCKINGEAFVARDATTVPVSPGLVGTYNAQTGDLEITASEPRNDDHFKRSVLMVVQRVRPGVLMMGESAAAQVYFSFVGGVSEEYLANTPESGSVTITRLDTIENIVSGTFSFVAQPQFASDKTASITEGRFDIRYPK